MKYIIIALCFLASFKATSQVVVDTVPSAIQIAPKVNELTSDTAYQLTWKALDYSSDTTKPVQFYIAYYNRIGANVYALNTSFDATTINQWRNSSGDDFITDKILNRFNLQRRN